MAGGKWLLRWNVVDWIREQERAILRHLMDYTEQFLNFLILFFRCNHISIELNSNMLQIRMYLLSVTIYYP
jgi:hypothetical protein